MELSPKRNYLQWDRSGREGGWNGSCQMPEPGRGEHQPEVGGGTVRQSPATGAHLMPGSPGLSLVHPDHVTTVLASDWTPRPEPEPLALTAGPCRPLENNLTRLGLAIT